MQKLKKVLSHDQGKSADTAQEPTSSRLDRSGPTGEGSHFAGVKSTQSSNEAQVEPNEYHPIYDQFTGSSPGQSTTENTQQPLNSSEQKRSEPVMAKSKDIPTSSTLSPATTTSTQRGTLTEGASTASIKSGVMGFPQDRGGHAALSPRSDTRSIETPTQGSVATNTTNSGEPKTSSNLGQDIAIGAGTAGVAHQLHRQPDHENLRDSSEQARERVTPVGNERTEKKDFAQSSQPSTGVSEQPFERSFRQEPVTDSGRSFPLAGGVVSSKRVDDPTPVHNTAASQPHNASTNEREPGTKEKAADVQDGHGREKLAGAAALAASAGAGTYAYRNRTGKDDREIEQERTNQGHGALSGVTGSSSTSNERTVQPSEHHSDAVAAAAAAYKGSTSSTVKSEHDHLGHGHNFTGDPCISEKQPHPKSFTDGPHFTDTANRLDPQLDPHLHIPGEFPETPLETPSDQKTGAGGYIPGPAGRHTESHSIEPSVGIAAGSGLPSTQHQETPVAEPVTPEKNQHHYGRDAAVAGGLGAAGLGTYAATKHHDTVPKGGNTQEALAEASPYSSTKIDPRVNPHAPKFEEQRFDPTARKEPSPHSVTAHTAAPKTETSAREQPQVEQSESHHGLNEALVGAGAGAATAGGLLYASQRDADKPETGPASSTIGPHKSNVANVLDPRVQPDPALQKHHQSGSTTEDPASHTIGPHKSNVANVLDPRVQPDPAKQKATEPTAQPATEQHHYGRDAALAGGAGAAGYGAYEAAKSYGDHRGTQAPAAMNDQRYDPTVPGAHDPTAPSSYNPNDPNQSKEHHYGRDAAIAGGLGAAGAGAYAATRHHDQAPQSQTYQQGSIAQTQQPPVSHGQQPPLSQTTQQPPLSQSQQPEAGHQRYDSVQDPYKQQDHDKRNAALGTAGVAAAAGAGAYAYSQHDAEKAEKERLAAQRKAEEKELAHQRKAEEKELAHQHKQDQKELAHRQKEQDKAFEKQQRELEKQQTKDQKKHDKFVAAEAKSHQKETEKERERQQQLEQQQQRPEDEDEHKEKKHHLFGFLHRDKTRKERKGTSSASSSPRSSRDLTTGAGAAGASGLAAHEYAQDSDTSEGRKHRNKLHKDPPKGHPAREALEHPEQFTSSAQQEKGLVTEPNTGLPMNVEKYGTDGAGGVDGSRTVEGYNSPLRSHGQTN
ncbi:hypothetical protein BU24DRAFT_496060 [Aaosphaeria arxii CBS 175.79]|uniref:Uncharacterized protein n=1 Tax=Aaosphaeria arxii CBS 175.79 TaxID=1450172 RepID=A0A6A5XDN7_9PLEO|nr:uncharacterized protein BU24DRAFT_496060 [Aaosphaeria arxii CBS 175.79]KAF2010884.1 hypothetical protein BU24DRAFT_496060 [Aaosphaeria arxii CBS 175.79]